MKKKLQDKKNFFLNQILKKINQKIIGSNLTKKLPKINSSSKKLDTLPLKIS